LSIIGTFDLMFRSSCSYGDLHGQALDCKAVAKVSHGTKNSEETT
jgi:hypothetical protein